MTRLSSAIVLRGFMKLSVWRKVHRACRSTRRTASTARLATSRTRPRTSTGSFRKVVEAPITRTCNLAFCLLPALLVAGAAAAEPIGPIRADLSAYLLARMANSAGQPDRAIQGYQAALASSPDNRIIAEGAFAQ